MAALVKRGLHVAPFKVGPDFIDPGHHTRVTGIISRNLDGWMLSQEDNLHCFYHHTRKADIAATYPKGGCRLRDGSSLPDSGWPLTLPSGRSWGMGSVTAMGR